MILFQLGGQRMGRVVLCMASVNGGLWVSALHSAAVFYRQQTPFGYTYTANAEATQERPELIFRYTQKILRGTHEGLQFLFYTNKPKKTPPPYNAEFPGNPLE